MSNIANHPQHLQALKTGYETWYSDYMTRIPKVGRDYSIL